MLSHTEIRKRFREFFTSQNHVWVQSSSLQPGDPSVLFTTAGMQQFKPYYTGQADAKKDFGSLNTASIQKCLRTSDIDEVGDSSHLTFFEMMGNFSFGGYWKEGAIRLAYDFITKELGLEIDYVTVFEGELGVPSDQESENIWKKINPNLEIRKSGINDNFWGPTGSEGPCGPTTEIYVKGIEVWNIVFNEYFYPGSREELLSTSNSKSLAKLQTQGIDTGLGLERLAMVVQNKENIFETDLFLSLIEYLPQEVEDRVKRIVADHCRAIVFLLADGIFPSNKDQGYILRRLIRRVIVHSHINNFPGGTKTNLLKKIVELYKPHYPNLEYEMIVEEFKKESEKFRKTLHNGLRELDHINIINAESAFRLYESFGLPFEIIKELGDKKAKDLSYKDFELQFKAHQEKSRAGSVKKFGGHGLDNQEINSGSDQEVAIKTKLHTATHLLQSALRSILGSEVKQVGSDITTERLRFDFNFSRKLSDEEIKRVENSVNDAVQKNLPVKRENMEYSEAVKKGALAFFKEKYPDRVSVYTIGDDSAPFSRELCGGPHVSTTGEIGHFKISKEEGISAGVRRIRAIIS